MRMLGGWLIGLAVLVLAGPSSAAPPEKARGSLAETLADRWEGFKRSWKPVREPQVAAEHDPRHSPHSQQAGGRRLEAGGAAPDGAYENHQSYGRYPTQVAPNGYEDEASEQAHVADAETVFEPQGLTQRLFNWRRPAADEDRPPVEDWESPLTAAADPFRRRDLNSQAVATRESSPATVELPQVRESTPPYDRPSVVPERIARSGEPRPAFGPPPIDNPHVENASADAQRIPLRPEPAATASSQQSLVRVESTGPERVVVGRASDYKVTVFNDGVVEASQIEITVAVPAWAEITRAAPKSDPTRALVTGWAVTSVKWTIACLPAAGMDELHLTVVPLERKPVELDVQWTSAEVESPEPIATPSKTTPAKLELAVAAPKQAIVGTPSVLEVVVSNSGGRDAGDVVVRVLSAGGSSLPLAQRRLETIVAGAGATSEVELIASAPGSLALIVEVLSNGGVVARERAEISLVEQSSGTASNGSRAGSPARRISTLPAIAGPEPPPKKQR